MAVEDLVLTLDVGRFRFFITGVALPFRLHLPENLRFVLGSLLALRRGHRHPSQLLILILPNHPFTLWSLML